MKRRDKLVKYRDMTSKELDVQLNELKNELFNLRFQLATGQLENPLKLKGVKTIIDLERTWWIQKRYKILLEQAGLKRLHIPMHASKVPTAKEWRAIKTAFEHPVYLHCKWGADRTGSVIGRYLVEEKGYSSKEAWQAVISKGSHAGYIGGLKKGRAYQKLKLFIWQGPQ